MTRHRTTPRDPRTFLLAPCTGLVLVLSLGALTGCGDDDEPTDTTSTVAPTLTTTPGSAPGSTTALANPASELCVHSGGTIEIVDEAGGQVAYCTLPDGTRFEEWDYFRQMTSTTTTTP